MPRDEALLQALRNGAGGPAWRLYTWTAPAVTYGHAQAEPPFAAEVPAFKRISGGGFVPHGADFTYCVVRERRIGESNYEDIVAAVAAALRSLGIAGAAVWRSAPAGKAGYCFASLAPFDIHVRGRKIAGCAQRRHKDVILHHGSIAAAAAPDILVQLGLVDAARTTTIEQELGRPTELGEFAAALASITGMDYDPGQK